MSPRRILIADHVSKVLGGAEVNVVELLGHPELASRWQVTVACAPGSPLDSALAAMGVDRVPYGFAPALNELRVVGRSFSPWAKVKGLLELQRATGTLRELISRLKPEAVLTPTNKDHFAAGAAAARSGIPSVWWVNDLLTPEFFGWPIRRAFSHKARRLSSRLAPVSQAGADALVRLGVPQQRIRTILNGIPLDRYVRDATRPLRAQLDLAPREPLIGVVGRITPWKGQELFLQIAEQWIASGRAGRFVIIGRAFNEDAPFEQQLRSRIAQAPLHGRVSMVPFQSDIAAALSSLDVLLHTSLKPEPFGRVLIESMAVGTPLVAAGAGGVTAILTSDIDGLVVPPGDAGAYLNSLRRLLDDAPGTRLLTEAARETVQERFSLDRVFGDFERLFKELAQTEGVRR